MYGPGHKLYGFTCVPSCSTYEDDMATREGALYGGKTHKPSALVLYIMEHVNPGLLENPTRFTGITLLGRLRGLPLGTT